MRLSRRSDGCLRRASQYIRGSPGFAGEAPEVLHFQESLPRLREAARTTYDPLGWHELQSRKDVAVRGEQVGQLAGTATSFPEATGSRFDRAPLRGSSSKAKAPALPGVLADRTSTSEHDFHGGTALFLAMHASMWKLAWDNPEADRYLTNITPRLIEGFSWQ
jgi:hypothetical protein